MTTLRAFATWSTDWPSEVGIVAATSPSRARHRSFCGAREAGFDLPFTSFRARRVPELDWWTETDDAGRAAGMVPWAIDGGESAVSRVCAWCESEAVSVI